MKGWRRNPKGARASGVAASVARVWVRTCTAGMPTALRNRRRAELESEIWEWERDAEGAPWSRAGASARVLANVMRGALDDLRWRREELRGSGHRTTESQGVAGEAGLSAFDARRRRDRTTESQGVAGRTPAGGEGHDPGRRDINGRRVGRPLRVLYALAQDVRFGARSLRRDPAFTAVAVLCLALGIGANTAIFSVVNGVLLRALPYAAPGELVVLGEYRFDRGAPSPGDPNGAVSYANALDWKAEATTLADLAIVGNSPYLMLDADAPEQIRAAPVTPNYFDMLGVPAALGRVLVPGEADPVVVLSDELWRRSFGAAPDVVGRSIRLNDEVFEIVGVMPPGFRLPYATPELWVPFQAAPAEFFVNLRANREARAFLAIGRLAPGVSLARAATELELIVERLRREYPDANEGYGLQLVHLHENRVGRVRPTLLTLLGAVGLLLMIACVNVANLLLARITARSGEVAVRSALGAGRWRIARQLVTESTLLSLAAGALGLLLAIWSVRLIKATSPGDIPRLDQVSLDPSVLAFTFLVSLAVGWLFGLAPAVQAARAETGAMLQRRGGLPGGAAPGARLRSGLVIAEVALALVLVLGAGLLINSFRYLWTYDPGFDPRGVLAADIRLERSRYPDLVQKDAFFQDLYERLRALPGVESVGGVGRLPGEPTGIVLRITGAEGTVISPDEPMRVPDRPVSGDYFETMRIPLVAGRLFRDGESGVAVINEAMARELWPEGTAVGRRVDAIGRSFEIVGVVGDQRWGGIDPVPKPEMTLPQASGFAGGYSGLVVVLRTRGDPLRLAGAVREAVSALDPEQPIASIRTVEQALADTMARPRFYMALFSLFGAVALALSAAGIFGVASYSVTRRTHELGVRVALGARRGDVLKLIIGQGAVLTGIGVVIGVTAARALTRYVESFLYGVTPNDPATFATVSLLLTAVALLSFWVPARRAAGVDPVIALRRE